MKTLRLSLLVLAGGLLTGLAARAELAWGGDPRTLRGGSSAANHPSGPAKPKLDGVQLVGNHTARDSGEPCSCQLAPDGLVVVLLPSFTTDPDESLAAVSLSPLLTPSTGTNLLDGDGAQEPATSEFPVVPSPIILALLSPLIAFPAWLLIRRLRQPVGTGTGADPGTEVRATVPAPAPPLPPASGFVSRLWHRYALKRCVTWHSAYHQVYGGDATHAKIMCTRCGRRFNRSMDWM